MKLKNIFLATLVIGILTGCNQSPEQCVSETTHNFANPTKVGNLNGQELYCVKVVNYKRSDHYVYFFKNSTNNVITANRTEMVGKTTVNRVEVFIDGKPYTATPKDN